MSKYDELSFKRPGLAAELSTMSANELREHYAHEVLEREEMESDFNHISSLMQNYIKRYFSDEYIIQITQNETKILK